MQYDPMPSDEARDARPPRPATAAPSADPADRPRKAGQAASGRAPKAAAPPPGRRGGGAAGGGNRRPWLRWGLPLVAALLVGAAAGVAVAAAIHMPRVDSITDFTPKLITTLHDRQGDTFATFARERRVLLDESEVPEVLEQALLAVEDSKFYQHGGIDLAAVVRAEVANLRAGERVEGASTLTMQLARTLFLTREKTWRRKIEETLLAVELEKSLSKQQILTLYMNLMNLGHGNYGFASAARYYFGKEVGQLEVHEAAMLAGIVQMPSRLSPYRRPDLVRERRDWVLRRMLDEGFISRDQHAAAVAEPLGVVTHAPDSPFAPYFVEDVRRYLEPTYGTAAVHEGGMEVWTTLDPAIQRAAETALDEGLLRIDHRRWRGAVRNLVEQGEDPETVELDVWASQPLLPGHWVQGVVLDAGRERARVRVQEEEFEIGPEAIEWTRRGSPSDVLSRGDVAWFEVLAPAGAEAAVDEAAPDEPGEGGEGAGALDLPPAMPDLDPTALRLALQQVPEVQGAVVVLEAATGAIRAMVGGWDFERSKFNRVTQAQRQVGSAFKPFVYGTALEMGYTPADTLFDGPTGFPGATGELTYWPRNHGRNYHGIVTLRYALERSINIPAVKLLDLVGIDRVVDFARRAGIRSELPPYPSLALGSADISPLEMAAAYAAILNQGTWVEPYMIERVTSAGGQLLEQHTPVTGTVTDPRVAYVLTHMMEGVVDRGTAGSVRGLPIDLAGKTGTTDDYTDAWFVGFTPRFVVLAWVGHDVKRSLGSGMTGSVVALPIWRDVVEAGLEDGWLREGETFTPPPGVVFETVEYRTGLLPGAAASAGEAGGTIQEAFLRGTEPVQSSTPRTALVHSLPWYQQRPFYIPKEGENMTSRRAAAEAEDGEVPEGGGESPADVAETAGAE